uniref:Stealth protein CR4 conserved region 4 domain-containing protein n=1 Tax=Hippocampus comes TaxID=109280 RepID=A0A3Q2YCI2_HIPCM
MGKEEIHFKLLHSDVAEADRIFDDVRQRPRKFICMNDDLDYTQSTAKQVQNKLAKFYQSMFPRPSQFELPKGKSNRFLHMDDLIQTESTLILIVFIFSSAAVCWGDML